MLDYSVWIFIGNFGLKVTQIWSLNYELMNFLTWMDLRLIAVSFWIVLTTAQKRYRGVNNISLLIGELDRGNNKNNKPTCMNHGHLSLSTLIFLVNQRCVHRKCTIGNISNRFTCVKWESARYCLIIRHIILCWYNFRIFNYIWNSWRHWILAQWMSHGKTIVRSIEYERY